RQASAVAVEPEQQRHDSGHKSHAVNNFFHADKFCNAHKHSKAKLHCQRVAVCGDGALRRGADAPLAMTAARKQSFQVAVILLCVAQLTAGLKCVCPLCANHTCETATDGACWNSVMLIDGKEETVKSCLSPSEMKGQVFCYSSRNVSKRSCCFTDFCNNETLHLHR
ncbi:hypothetical protein ATANTOWER_008761, partial [Ataeniobius toweri]|nr:hypothetical protein [Ataeniobius toweri]